MNTFDGKIAVHAITWGQDHLLAMEEASKLGYKAIEPWPSFALQYEDRIDEYKEILNSYGLQLSALYGGASGESGRKFTDPSKRQSVIDFNVRLAKIIAACGAGHLVFGPGAPRTHSMTSDEVKEAVKTINEAAKRTFELGVKSCLHPHLWTELQDENELDALMELCDPETVFLAPDTAHLTGAGMDVPAIIRRYKDRVAYVHLKDLVPRDVLKEEVTMVKGNEALTVFCELGLGTIKFEPIIEALKEIQYKGFVTVEIDYSTSTPYQSLEICRDFVEQKLSIPIRK
ncbi:sugar phosphate isomerase/epimerase family protein [Paenibacillus eucommiae]|uniref:Inosose dehydratase n=1 Tax=Paenibacillus eucommiae TaxID=1355755 RepID=A0ABS4J5Q6_9BACL|nr:sugar phosphate isomerase/epimerase family protein [Paenibacillus eucommiae]MBP1994615.1 inosose dehydratase [Paenibacillus eucommiae]